MLRHLRIGHCIIYCNKRVSTIQGKTNVNDLEAIQELIILNKTTCYSTALSS